MASLKSGEMSSDRARVLQQDHDGQHILVKVTLRMLSLLRSMFRNLRPLLVPRRQLSLQLLLNQAARQVSRNFN